MPAYDWALRRGWAWVGDLNRAVKRRISRPEEARVDWGTMRVLRPLSDDWGFDRGSPIDRYWIETFLDRHRTDIRGDVLEVLNATYTRRFGTDRVERSRVLDIDPHNAAADVIVDLSDPRCLPRAAFDCFILTQTLQLIPEPTVALDNAWWTLREGGTLLVTVPVISRLADPKGDYWRFTPAGLELLLRKCCPGDIDVTGFGNVFAAMSFLAGQAREELERSELDLFDPDFASLACARVVKRGS